MFGSNGTSFPITGLAIVALFLSTAFLGQHGFNLLRQTESDTAPRLELAEPRVEARLWEDPLAALQRHLEKLPTLCRKIQAAAPASAQTVTARPSDTSCPEAEPITIGDLSESLQHKGPLTVLAALLPGGAFVGAGEARRRARYALLAGLNAAGYVPENSERMGWLQVKHCASFSGCATVAAASLSTVDIAYETLSAVPTTNKSEPTRHVVVLWLDDTALGKRWLTTVTTILSDLRVPQGSGLRVLGPATSDALVQALKDDLPILVGEAKDIAKADQEAAKVRGLLNEQIQKLEKGEGDSRQLKDADRRRLANLKKQLNAFRDPSLVFVDNWKTLADIRLISPSSTASDAQLLAEIQLPQRTSVAARVHSVEDAFEYRFGEVRNAYNAVKDLPRQSPFFIRTIGTDDKLIERLVAELCSRGLDARAHGPSSQVALISEWDSIYSRSFVTALRDRASCNNGDTKINVESYLYLRGLDGVTLDGASKPSGTDDDKARASDKLQDGSGPFGVGTKPPPVEWPEGRDQRDYLRRLVDQRLERNDWRSLRGSENELQAIGIMGYDVHDKLVLAQALRDAFPDRTIFTTDLDARLLHPGVTQYTRNLIVASSLPLAFDKEKDRLQCGIAPFRDSYQTAMFLAARYAATDDDNGGRGCHGLNGTELKKLIDEELAKPRLFEIGRDGPVELVAANAAPRTPAGTHQSAIRRNYALISGGLLVILATLMTLGWPGPAMRAARGQWVAADRPPTTAGSVPLACSLRSTKLVSGLQVASFGFAAGVIVELGAPGRVGFVGAILFAAAAAAYFWLFLYPGTPWMRWFRDKPGRADAPVKRVRRSELVVLQLVLFVAAFVVLWLIFVVPSHPRDDVHEPFGTFSGVSSWPAELLRTLSIVLFAWFLDYVWCNSAHQADRTMWRYFPKADAAVETDGAAADASWGTRAIAALRNASIWFWQPKDAPPADGSGTVDGARLWQEYRMRLFGWRRLGRNVLWFVVSLLLLYLVTELMGGAEPEVPARGIDDRTLFKDTLVISGLMVLSLIILVGDVTVLTWRFVTLLKRGRTIYPRATVKGFAAELGPELQALASRRLDPNLADRDLSAKGERTSRRSSLLDDWIDIRLLAEHTAAIGPLIVFPFVLIALMIIARSRLFDNWQIGGSLLIMFAGFVLWSIAVAVLLSYGAERARRTSLDRMQSDLIWLKGAGAACQPLADQFARLIDQVRTLRQGAFAPFFEQPAVQALLVPLGSAGGLQLVEYLLFAQR
jgi:hypothetical protein